MTYLTFFFTTRRQFTHNHKYQYNQVILKMLLFSFFTEKETFNVKSFFLIYKTWFKHKILLTLLF